MPKANNQGWITISIAVVLIIASVVGSHVRLEGKIETLSLTNKQFHDTLKESLDEVKTDVKNHLQVVAIK